MRSTGLLALVLAVIPAFGCGDDIKFPDPPEVPDPALNAVIPARGFTSRTIEVQVSGDGTEFVDGATVNFGAGITVGDVVLASPSDLLVTITIAGDAAIGKRDVVVTSGDESLTLAQAFDVQAAIDVFTVGALQQGGFAQVLIINRDFEHPFLGDITITAGAGVAFNLFGAPTITENSITALATFDTDAVSGPVTITDTLGNDVLTTSGATLTVAARTAVPLQPVGKGTGVGATATMNGTTELFSYTTSGLVMATVDTTDVNSLPFMIFLGDGKWANARGFVTETIDTFGGNDPIPATGTEFVVVVDNAGLTGFSFDLVVDDDFFPLPSATLVSEVEPNADEATATVVGASHLVSAQLNTDTDEDFYKITLTVGQAIRVQTTSGISGAADTEIDIINAAGALIDFSGDSFNGEGITTGPLPAGDYFIIVFPGFLGFAGDEYEAGIDILPAAV